jgi:hypothetical protein
MCRVVTVGAVALFLLILGGCTQRDDIVTTIKRSELTLEPANLPAPPGGLVYELWISEQTVTDTAFDMGQAISLGRFSYIEDDTLVSFLDTNGSPRSAMFSMDGDFRTYRSVFVSLQRRTDPAGTRPGAIMLIAWVPGLPDIPIKMLFPQADSLWTATCRFNLEGISDNNRDAGDGRGVWFASYRTEVLQYPDTNSLTVDTTALDTMKPYYCGTPPAICNLESLTREYDYSITNIRDTEVRIRFPNDTLILNRDSFMHTKILFDVIKKKDTIPPYVRRRLKFTYGISADSLKLDIFSQDNFGLPVVSEWGWKYCGWVASPNIPISDSIGTFTPPAWKTKTYFKDWLPGIDSGVLSTGTFADIGKPDDDGNPFALNTYLPPFPGEDFLNTAALQSKLGVSSVTVLPTATNNIGTVFVSCEPVNRLTTKSNFPLIAFSGRLPTDASYAAARVSYSMVNATSTLMGNDVYTFPVITVKVQRY